MSDMLIDIQYDPERNDYIYSFRMSEEKKHDLENACKVTAQHWKKQSPIICRLLWIGKIKIHSPKYKNVSPWDTSKTRGVGSPVPIIHTKLQGGEVST